MTPFAAKSPEPCETLESPEAVALGETEEEEEAGGIPWRAGDTTAVSPVISSTTMGCSESSTSPANPRGVNRVS